MVQYSDQEPFQPVFAPETRTQDRAPLTAKKIKTFRLSSRFCLAPCQTSPLSAHWSKGSEPIRQSDRHIPQSKSYSRIIGWVLSSPVFCDSRASNTKHLASRAIRGTLGSPRTMCVTSYRLCCGSTHETQIVWPEKWLTGQTRGTHPTHRDRPVTDSMHTATSECS